MAHFSVLSCNYNCKFLINKRQRGLPDKLKYKKYVYKGKYKCKKKLNMALEAKSHLKLRKLFSDLVHEVLHIMASMKILVNPQGANIVPCKINSHITFI